jgi:hypothetical protein
VDLRAGLDDVEKILDPTGSRTPTAKKKCKAIPVTGRGGPYGCETSRLPHFLYSRLTDGGEAASFTRRPPFTPRKILGTHFC